ncbi:MAG: Cyclodipeptide synthase [Bradyrhizobium sp.]|nr:Cyclodipeptide synthase [Bradyrhizobium sp.]
MEHAAGNVYDETAATECLAGARMFIPISLGNHYYSSEVLNALLSHFIAGSRCSVIFLCDRLRFLSYRIRGETDDARIVTNIRLQLDQMNRTLINLGLSSHSNVRVVDWSFLQDDSRYAGVLESLEELVRTDPWVQDQVDRYVAQFVGRFYTPQGPQRDESIQLQRRYLVEETALSLYMTEVRGFNVEVYRRGMGFVDDLYSKRPVELMSMLKKSTLERKFVSIEHWLERAKAEIA